MTASVERAAAGELRVVGQIDFENANELRQQGERLIESEASAVRIDLAGLIAGGSVAIAVLLAWFRHASRLEREICYANVPSGLANVIEFSGLLDIIPIEACESGS